MNKKDVLKIFLKVLLSFLGIFVGFGLIFCAIIWSLQDKILFYPYHDENSYNELANKNGFEEVKIESDKWNLHGWIKRNSDLEKAPLVIYFGGNAQNSSHTFDNFNDENFFKYFEEYNVLYVDYPGYGLSTGSPSGSNLLEAGLIVYDYVDNLEFVDKENIIILGFSIGTGVATYVSSLREVNGLILLAPYDELLSIYNEKINIFYGPLKMLVKHNITSYQYAADVRVSPLIIMTKDDQVINYKYSLNLVNYFKDTDDVIVLDGFGHNSFLNQDFIY